MGNKRAAMRFYEGGLTSSEIEDLPWYEWHLILKEIEEHHKAEKERNKSGNSAEPSMGDAQKMMKNAQAGMPKASNFKMPKLS